MFRRLLPLVSVLLAILSLASCASFNQDPIRRPYYYDVREAGIIANDRVPMALLAGLDDRLAGSIEATRRIVPTQRVVLTVRIEDYRPAGQFWDRRGMARFRVTAADVESGNPVAAGTFIVYSNTNNPQMAEQSLAEEIAARVRFAFALQTPRVAAIVRPRPQQSPRVKPAVQQRTAPVRTPVAEQKPQPAVMPKPAVSAEPAAAPQPAAAPAKGPATGTNTEEGASGTITLGAAKPAACDASTDPSCKPAAQ